MENDATMEDSRDTVTVVERGMSIYTCIVIVVIHSLSLNNAHPWSVCGSKAIHYINFLFCS